MADIKLFSIKGEVQELSSKQMAIEKDLQKILEENMQIFFGVTFLSQNIELQTVEWIVSV